MPRRTQARLYPWIDRVRLSRGIDVRKADLMPGAIGIQKPLYFQSSLICGRLGSVPTQATSQIFPTSTGWKCNSLRIITMQTEPIVQPRDPVAGVEIADPTPGTIYLLPTSTDVDGKRAYMGADAHLFKIACGHGIDIDYAVPEGGRVFVEHYSAGLDIINLAVAVFNLIPSTVQGIYALIQIAALRKGIKPEELPKAEVHLKMDFLKTSKAEAHGVEIKGESDSVVSIIEELSRDS